MPWRNVWPRQDDILLVRMCNDCITDQVIYGSNCLLEAMNNTGILLSTALLLICSSSFCYSNVSVLCGIAIYLIIIMVFLVVVLFFEG